MLKNLSDYGAVTFLNSVRYMYRRTVMKNQKQPLYLAIYSDIREKIAKNTYTDGDYLPSERKLCDEYGVE